jgi:eukaryotic-like serine/threonine-protein kinase
MPLTIGQVLENRYRIEAVLGRGGMGAVYRATDLRFGTPVAIKENLVADPSAQQQFAREAALLHQMRHNSLPRVTDHFSIPGQGQYLVMDYIDGPDLGRILRQQGPLDEAQALAWMGQVLDALEYLHGQTPPIVHRDIKPANIKVRPDGRVFLVDFGIAKVDPLLRTATGARYGTPGYAPPEQYGRGYTDERSDLYAVGATLYALLTGREPEDSVDLMLGAATLAPPRQVSPRLSPATEAAILKAMQSRPTDRPQTAAQLRTALAAPLTQPPKPALASQPVSVPPPVRRPTTSRPGALWPIMLGSGVLFVAIVLGFVLLLGSGPDRATPTATTAAVVQAGNTDTPTSTPLPTGTLEPPTKIPTLTVTPEPLTDTLAPPTPVPQPTDTPVPPTSTPRPTDTRVPPTDTPKPAAQTPDTRTRTKDGMVMVYVPAGEFTMGSTEADINRILAQCSDCQRAWYEDELPQHTVYLDGFWIDKHPVTNAQYRRCVEQGACRAPGCWDNPDLSWPNQPVVCVNWSDAQAYAAWVGGRLPTEAEWEKAARGTDARIFPWGNRMPDCALANYTFGCVNHPTNVLNYPAGVSPYGISDMAGNVLEWVADWYGPAYYGRSPARNPTGPETGTGRVLRGGSFFKDEWAARCTSRREADPTKRAFERGFRLAASVPPQ